MAVSAPEVTIEKIINDGFVDLLANAAAQVPLILAAFPPEYIAETVAYITDPAFKPQTIFSYYFDPAQLPAFNIVLAAEGEDPSDGKMYLNDIVEAAANIPNTQPYQSQGSDWACRISVIIRAQKARQTLVLYNILKWMMLKNRTTLETAGIKASKFSGRELAYTPTQPTLIFNREFIMDCRIYNTVDTPILPPSPQSITIREVISAWPTEVHDLPQEDEVLGGNTE
ncbi:Uncharacterised protein [uncultured archaeon]|nr:Uncharacterised protein [uncultured archaeon]